MHKVISNTTPILSLLKIDKIDLLKELFESIIIPKAVFQEIEKGLIDSVGKLLIELTEKGTWLTPKLISKAKKIANEE